MLKVLSFSAISNKIIAICKYIVVYSEQRHRYHEYYAQQWGEREP